MLPKAGSNALNIILLVFSAHIVPFCRIPSSLTFSKLLLLLYNPGPIIPNIMPLEI